MIPTLAIQNPKRVAIDGKLHRLSSYGKKSVSRHKLPATMPIKNTTKYDFLLSLILITKYLLNCQFIRRYNLNTVPNICQGFLPVIHLLSFAFPYAVGDYIGPEMTIVQILLGAMIMLACSLTVFVLSCPVTTTIFRRKEY